MTKHIKMEEHMIKRFVKNVQGISLISLVITIVVLLIIASIVVYKMGDFASTSKFNKMKADIELLHDKMLAYNQKYGKLPVKEEDGQPKVVDINYVKELLLESKHDQRGENDSDIYYIVDVTKLENITLNYGRGNEENQDYYIVNSGTFNVYYVKGMKLENKIYYIGNEYTGTKFEGEELQGEIRYNTIAWTNKSVVATINTNRKIETLRRLDSY
jgi:type II secretory pathway pseudopilin PulG